METVILVIHLLIALALIGVVLLQRSEGGALGIGGGGGGGSGNLFSARGVGNALTRTTAYLAVAFFCHLDCADGDRHPARWRFGDRQRAPAPSSEGQPAPAAPAAGSGQAHWPSSAPAAAQPQVPVNP